MEGNNDPDPDLRTYGLKDGLEALEEWDEPTLLVFPDGVGLQDASILGALQQAGLSQCAELKDRFAIMDILAGYRNPLVGPAPVDLFRQNVGVNFLNYGAVYHPWIQAVNSFDIKLTFQLKFDQFFDKTDASRCRGSAQLS